MTNRPVRVVAKWEPGAQSASRRVSLLQLLFAPPTAAQVEGTRRPVHFASVRRADTAQRNGEVDQ